MSKLARRMTANPKEFQLNEPLFGPPAPDFAVMPEPLRLFGAPPRTKTS
jgi:hypothetical protein